MDLLYVKREANLLETEIEKSLSVRMKKFIPSNFDLVDYDKELLKKQLDLETVQVTLTKPESNLKKSEEDLIYTRSVVRFNNEEGTFNRLMNDL